MIATGIDTETTGLSQADGHRIIEIAILHYDLASRKLIDKYVKRIDPRRPIDAAAQEVHGIAYTDLEGLPVWEDLASEISAELAKSNLLIAHNRDFDMPFIAGELTRVGAPVPNIASYCTMENGRWATFNGKFPRLEELCFALGVEYDNSKSHAAEYDVDVMIQSFFKGLDRGFFNLSQPQIANHV